VVLVDILGKVVLQGLADILELLVTVVLVNLVAQGILGNPVPLAIVDILDRQVLLDTLVILV